MRIAGGETQAGIVIGNTYDKYGSQNPIVRVIMKGYDTALNELIGKINPSNIHELGCGEGYWIFQWRKRGIEARGSDFSNRVIEIARANANRHDVPQSVFQVGNIYEVQASRDSADLIVCCEVLEHLENPRKAFEALRGIVTNFLILSVPREPIWRLLNLVRGRYIMDYGNTPGHLQHWSKNGFITLVSEYFDVTEVRQPLPWTMLLCRQKVKR